MHQKAVSHLSTCCHKAAPIKLDENLQCHCGPKSKSFSLQLVSNETKIYLKYMNWESEWDLVSYANNEKNICTNMAYYRTKTYWTEFTYAEAKSHDALVLKQQLLKCI